jgi:6-phosphogluconolactonase (cycloisomerase 2 family)
MRRARTFAVALGLLAALVATGGAAHAGGPSGSVYVLGNSPSGNAVLAYTRAADGSLSGPVSYPTGGVGTGAGLGSQGSVVLDGDDLYAVNAGSNSISRFSIRKGGLELVATVSSGGVTPISLTVHHDVLYVLNSGAGGNISGFSTAHGGLTPIPGSTRPMGPGATGPAQISFSDDGHVLVVTEKTTSSIETFYVDKDVPDAAAVFASTGGTPFGFDFDKHGNLLVSNAAGSASSYSLSREGRVNVISGAVPTFQAAPCWLVTSKDGRYAYTANAGPGTISGFTVGNDGSLTLLTPGGATASLGATAHPIDEAITGDGRYLYNLTDGLHRISGFSIGTDGSLTGAGYVAGLPVGAAGIAAS